MKKGFTLIELLAVIVVLAILALIVTPIVLNIIENVQRGADERSIEQYAKVMQTTFYEMQVKDPSLTLEEYLSNVDTASGVSLSYNGSKVVCSEKKAIGPATGVQTIELRNCMIDGRGPYDFINGSVVKKDNASNSGTSSTVKYTIKTTLTDVTISNSATSIKQGESYSATLTPKDQYEIDTVKVTMGGTDVTSSVYKNGKITMSKVTGNIEITVTAVTTQFAQDSWETIIANVKNGNISAYKLGDTKRVTLTSTDEAIAGTYKVRIANTSTLEECNAEGFSQTACGFVIEFVDIITSHNMNLTATSRGGWPASSMYTYVNNDIYNALPNEIKEGIIDTYAVSGFEHSDSSNFISTDKLYLLSSKEVWGSSYSTASSLTRQLDYYKNLGVESYKNNDPLEKKYNGKNIAWFLRTGYDFDVSTCFMHVADSGIPSFTGAQWSNGVAPAFRIG